MVEHSAIYFNSLLPYLTLKASPIFNALLYPICYTMLLLYVLLYPCPLPILIKI